MTDNLKLVGSKTLTPANSNVASNFTLPASNSGTWCTDTSESCADTVYVYSGNSYGAVYSWAAATAGAGKSYSYDGYQATYSICPKGWYLPSYTTFGILLTKYDSSAALYNSKTFSAQGTGVKYGSGYDGSNQDNVDAIYWTQSTSGRTAAWDLYIQRPASGNVHDRGTSNRFQGLGVRCARD